MGLSSTFIFVENGITPDELRSGIFKDSLDIEYFKNHHILNHQILSAIKHSGQEVDRLNDGNHYLTKEIVDNVITSIVNVLNISQNTSMGSAYLLMQMLNPAIKEEYVYEALTELSELLNVMFTLKAEFSDDLNKGKVIYSFNQ